MTTGRLRGAHRRAQLALAVTTLLLTSSCASAIGSQAADSATSPTGAEKPQSGTVVTVMLKGGTYHWALPKVDLGPVGTETAPAILAPTAPDPVTGSAILPLRYGDGAPFTKLARVRLRYVQQGWHGQVLHDSWQDPGHPEAVPTGPLGDEIFGAVLRAHQGDIVEMVLAAEPDSGGESSVVVLSLDKV